MSDKSFWSDRVKNYGHTGWANPAIYDFDQPIRVKIVDKLIRKNLSSGGVLLDFGCGSGDFSVRESNYFEEIVLYDTCRDVLDIAKKRISNGYSVDSLDDFLSTQKNYDCIISITVLQHIKSDEELRSVIKYMADHISQNGIVILMEQFHKKNVDYIRSWNFESMNRLFEEVGFKVIESYDFYERGIFKDPVFDKFRHRPSIFLLYHLYAYIPFIRKIIRPVIHWLTEIKCYDKNVERYLFSFSGNDGDKFIVYKIMK